MLVKELKDVIKKYNDDEKQKIIVELYKRVPKRVKEDYEIDDFITNLKEQEKTKKQEEVISIDNLEKEINYFLKCANNGLYASPNKIISKKERQNWRFKVKKYYKDLNSFLPDTDEGSRATDLLKGLYKVLSTGSNYLRFSNWETFKAVGVSQSEFLEVIMNRKLTKFLSHGVMKYCVDLLLVEYDPYGSHMGLLLAFENCLKTIEAKNIAIEELKNKNVEMKSKYLDAKKKNNRLAYDYEETINCLTELIFNIQISLDEVEDAIKYFHENYVAYNDEVKEFILLRRLEDYGLYNYWIEEYEKYAKKINYRDSLKEKYKELKRG